jgi:hypothetical protein
VMGRSGPCNDETNGIRTRVNRCQLDRGRHAQRQTCIKACEGW